MQGLSKSFRVNFSFNRKVTKLAYRQAGKSRHVLIVGAKTSLFAKIPAALFLLKKLAENFAAHNRSFFAYALRNVRKGMRIKIENEQLEFFRFVFIGRLPGEFKNLFEEHKKISVVN